MSWTSRARDLVREGYSEADAYAIVAAERRQLEGDGSIEGGRGQSSRSNASESQPNDLDSQTFLARWPAGDCEDCGLPAEWRVMRDGMLVGPCCTEEDYFTPAPRDTDLEASGQLVLGAECWRDEEAA